MTIRKLFSFITIFTLFALLITGIADAKRSSFSSSSGSCSSSSFRSNGSSYGKGSSSYSKSSFGSSYRNGSSTCQSTPAPSIKSGIHFSGFFNNERNSQSKPSVAASTPPNKGSPPFTNSTKASAGSKRIGSVFGNNAILTTPINKTVQSTGTIESKPVIRYNSKSYINYNPTTRIIVVQHKPDNYRPIYYEPTYVYHDSPAVLNLWWEMEMLQSIHNMQEQQALIAQMHSDPYYNQWLNEANKLAIENETLKDQLNKVESSVTSNVSTVVSSVEIINKVPSMMDKMKKDMKYMMWFIITSIFIVSCVFIIRKF